MGQLRESLWKPRMRQLLYVSNSVRDFAQAELEDILAVSRRNNAAAGITGMLLYMDGAFLQVLEGEAEPVKQTYARIRQDVRHWGAQTLIDQDAPRAFAQWSMGFERLAKGRLDARQVFRITEEAVAAKLNSAAPVHIALLLRNFQHVNSGRPIAALTPAPPACA
jgi:hypothetical protein